ncbi:MAG: hypothetical protein ACYSW7_11500 [Planctomycetota bacterium]
MVISGRVRIILCLAAMICLLFGIYLTMGIKWAGASLLIIMLVVSILILYRTENAYKKAEKQYLSKIENREKLSFEEFAQKYYPDYDSSIVCKILEQIQENVGFPMYRLDPTDNLTQDLTIGLLDGGEQNLLLDEIADACDVEFDIDSFEECPSPPQERIGQLGYFIETIYSEIVKQKK